MNKRTNLKNAIHRAVKEQGFDRVAPQNVPRIRLIPLSEIVCDPNQPRKEFDEDALHLLAQSIDTYGQLSPILVQKHEGNRFRLVAGERRLRAHRILKREEIQAVVADGNAKVISVIENSQRKNLKPIEEAEAYGALIDDLKISQEDAATIVGLKRATFGEILRINDLPDHIKNECRTSGIPKSTLIQIARVSNLDDQNRLWSDAKSGATVRATRAGRRQARPDDPNREYKNRIATARRLTTLLAKAESPASVIGNEGHLSDLVGLRDQLNSAIEAFEKEKGTST